MSEQFRNHDVFKDQAKVTEEQLRAAKSARDSELNDMRAVLNTPQGRRVMWRLLEHTQVFASIWHQSALIHKNAGRQDVGHFVMAEIEAANQESLFTMMKEARGVTQCQE
jgi:hypothetical protein